MAVKLCSRCKQLAEFYPSSKSWCKQCTSAAHAKRHREQYAPVLRAARRKKQWALKAPRAPEHSVVDLAYMAGIIDGEGCIRLNYKTKISRYNLWVTVANTDKALLDWIAARWRGHVHVVKGKPEKNRRMAWRWNMAADLALHFLDEIYPYLVIKKRRAMLARRYQRYVQYGGRHGDPRVEPLQRKFYDMFKILNARGFQAGEAQWADESAHGDELAEQGATQ